MFEKNASFTSSSKIENNENHGIIHNQCCPTDNTALLNILLACPQDIELKEKPSAIRKTFFCTLDSKRITIASAMADDNGAYIAGGRSRKLYCVTFEANGWIKKTRTVSRDKDGTLFYCLRAEGRKGTVYDRVVVPNHDVYELTRTYRKNKANPALQHMIVTARRKDKKEPEQFYISSYRLDVNIDGQEFEEAFKLPSHGNATKPAAASYFRTDTNVLRSVKSCLQQKMSCEEVYKLHSNTCDTVSGELRNPRQVHNIKHQMNKRAKENESLQPKTDEIEQIICQMRDGSEAEQFTRALTILPKHYFSIHFFDESLEDIERFCVNDSSVFRVNTTFEIIKNLWVTDTSYTNSSLLCEHTGKNPEFPGPIMLHSRKDKATYRAFAAQLVAQNPALLDIKKIETDMDKAVSDGLGDIFSEANKLVCIQHLMETDAMQLTKMGSTPRIKQRIMADIYGSKQDRLLQFGLADADDEEDFDIKLESLFRIWEELVEGFHGWFKRRRGPVLKEAIGQSANDRIGIDGSFFENRLEVMHKLQNKTSKDQDLGKEVCEVDLFS